MNLNVNGRQVMVVSRGSWRGIPIYETGKMFKLFLVCLGTQVFDFNTIGQATAFIDAWCALRAN